MADTGAQRRLAAIVIADVVGYSRHMERDPTGTRQRFRALQDDVLQPILDGHQGRIVKTMGDGFLIEFNSVVSAVGAAVLFQRRMAENQADRSTDDRIRFRIGVNLGEIIVEGDDIHGEGVNVAARLEALADPGGVLLSGRVHEQLGDAIDVGYAFIGAQAVKNVTRPVRAFKVLLDPSDAGKGREPVPFPRKSRRPSFAAAPVLLLIAIVAVGGAWWWMQQPDFEPADRAKFAYTLPEKPSIAVLPFDNLTGDKKNEFVSDGLSENIIAVLSTQRNMFVIARNSSFSFKGKAVKVQRIAEQLGVRYILSGSVQRQGAHMRVTAQLIDALSGKHLWTGRYDHALSDVANYFAIQDKIAGAIARSLSVEINLKSYYRRVPKQLWNLDTLRVLDRATRTFEFWTKSGNQESTRLFTDLLKKHPDTALVLGMLAWCHWQRVSMGFSRAPRQDLAIAKQYAQRALAADQKLAMAHSALGILALYERKHDAAIAHADRARAVDPNGFDAPSGMVYLRSGQPKKAIAHIRAHMRREPFHQDWVPLILAQALLQLNQLDEARRIYESLLAAKTKSAVVHVFALRDLAVIAVRNDDLLLARKYVMRFRAIRPKASVATLRRSSFFWKNQAAAQRILDDLRRAGLPEHAAGSGAK